MVTMDPRRIAVALAGLLIACALGAPSAGASAPTLEGETFGGTTSQVGVNGYPSPICNDDGSATFSFFAYGTAAGPYPGTYYTQGTMTLGPRGLRSRAPVTALDATFSISSGATTVTGTATLGDSAAMLGFDGLLGGFDFRNEGECLASPILTVQFGAGIRYDATITTQPPDSYAKSSARNMVSQVESCNTDWQDYSLCMTAAQLGNTGLPIGSGPGQVEVTTATLESYTIVGHSPSGVDFVITKGTTGTISRTCTPRGEGTCLADGSWGPDVDPELSFGDSGVGALAGSGDGHGGFSSFLAGGFNGVPPNTAPACDSAEYALLAGQTLQLHCSDPDSGQTLTYSTVAAPAHGSLSASGAYTPDPGYLGFDTFSYRASDGSLDSAAATAKVLMAEVSQSVAAGGSVSTGSDATTADPIATTVTSPGGGTVAVSSLPLVGAPPAGYVVVGEEIDIVAPDATIANPLRIVFRVAAGSVDPATLTVLRNGVAVPQCASPPAPSPTCVVLPPATAADDDLLVTVFTTAASKWLVAAPIGALHAGFQAPIDGGNVINKAKVGRVVPVKVALSLGGTPVRYGDVRLASLAGSACSGGVEDPVDIYSAGQANTGTSFRFDPVSGNWIYNLSTSGLTVGKCYRGTVTLNGAVGASFFLVAVK